MATFIAAFIIFALAIAGMAIGVILSDKCLKRECEQRRVVMQNSGSDTCGTCGKKI
jgi:hypothetical protein